MLRLLSATLAGLILLGAGSARAASSASPPAPAGAVDPATHAQEVFWSGTGGDLQESYRYQDWRGPADVSARYGLGRTTARPAIAVGDDDQQYLFWRAAGGMLHEGHYTDRWRSYSFPAWGRATSAPAVAVDARSDHQYVFWRGGDGDIHEAWYTSRWHCCRDFTGWGRTASAPAVAVGDDEQQYVFWRAGDGTVHEAHHTTRWRTYAFSGWRTSSTPAVAVNPVNDHQYVFWRDPRGRITESRYSGGWHGPSTMAAWGRAAGPPTVSVADDSQQYVFWRSTRGGIDEAHHAHRWRTYSFPGWRASVAHLVSGTDSWPAPVGGSGPYTEPTIGGSYAGYIGMIGNWALWRHCQGGFLAWSGTNSHEANVDHSTYGVGIGTAAYWFMGGPGVDPRYDGTTGEARAWGRRQAQRALADVAHRAVTYRVLFMDVELPGIRPAPDNGWNSVYTSPCSGQTRLSHISPRLDRADFNGFWSYVTHHSAYTPGVYSSPGVWTKIFGGTGSGFIPHTDEWTYEPETTDLSRAPTGWCLPGGACAAFFGGVTRTSRHALMWQWSGGDSSRNGVGDFDQINAATVG